MNFFHEDSFLGSIVGPTSDGIDATEKCNIGPHRQQCKQRSMRSIATGVVCLLVATVSAAKRLFLHIEMPFLGGGENPVGSRTMY